MDSTTFYLKYRPQKISELDLVDIRQGLTRVLKSGKVPHALLFAGPRGTGKTSAARIVAKAVNCEKRKGFEPCNRCLTCREITQGSFLDLIEIDAASNRGIDDIRNLREKIKLAPAQGKYKVYIVDEAHMLTTEAFNALLKTLEEPPRHAIFILCTTMPEKLPKTIVSRCMRFNFRKAKSEEIVASLKPVVKKEKLKVEKGVLEEIAQSADGSFRDAKKVLEQLSFTGKKVTLKEARELLGKIEALSPGKLLALMAGKDTKASLKELDRVVTIGGDLAIYVQEILNRLRQGLLTKVGLTEVVEPEETKAYSLADLKVLIQFFSRAAQEMRTNPIPQLPLELVVVEWCEGSEGAGTPLFSETRAEVKGKTKPNNHSLSDPPIRELGSKTNLNRTADQYSSKRASPPLDGRLEEIVAKWDELLARVRPMNHSVEALLRAARPSKMANGVLILEVFYPFHKERLETEKCRSVVEEAASQILDAPVKIRCILGQRKTSASPVIADSVQTSSSPATDDIVKTAEEIFGTE